ncbi:MAG: AI-2E family transporter [Acidobacteriota bacterium]
MALELSQRQQAAISAAFTILAAFVILAAISAIFWLLGSFVTEFSNVLLPLAVAGIAALVFQPFYDWLHQTARLPPPVALGAVVLSGVLPLVAFGWFFGALLVEQIADLVQRAPEWWAGLRAGVEQQWPQVRTFFEQNPVGQQVREAVEEHGGELFGGVQSVVARAFSAGADLVGWIFGLLGWVVLPVYFAFFLMTDKSIYGDTFDDFLPFFKEETRHDVIYLAREFVNIIVVFFRGQLIVAFLQGLLFAVGFSVVGLRYGFVIGLVLGFLNIIPYLGNIVGLGVAIPLALFQTDGGWGRLLAVLVVFAIVQTIEGYLLTPKIMGDRTGLHPMVIIVAIFFWGSALNGILGMILAIPLTAFLVVVWKLAKEKYVRELV